jgi:hypothetical protein
MEDYNKFMPLLVAKAMMLVIIVSLLIITIGVTSCLPEQPTTESVKRKTAVVCKDSIRIVWNENLLIETSWLTGNPCYDHGGVAYYVYK